MNIFGKKVILRAVEKSDCEMIREMFNDPEIENLVVGWAFPLSEYSQEKWFESHYNDQNNLRLIIETKDHKSIGVISLTDINWKNRAATHGIKIASCKSRSIGFGTDALMSLMRYAFDEMQLNRLETTLFSQNEASRKLHKKCGWVEEGVKRQCVFKNGKYRDLIIAGILSSEYHELIRKNKYWEQ